MLTAALDAESDLASIPTDVLLATVVKRLNASVHITVSEAQAKKAGIGPSKAKPRAK